MLTRRQFAEAAAAAGAVLAFGTGSAAAPTWRERRDLYPQGVASGDPASDSVLLWTRRQPTTGDARAAYLLTVEVAKDPAFRNVVVRGKAEVVADTDWTCRFMAAGLEPATEYWYRFTDAEGNGSRVGRTLAAPRDGDARPVRFTFVSCQDMSIGAANAYRRMIHDDERRPRDEQLGFVLHLGDFIYEVINYADEMPEGKYRGRRLRPLFKYPDGEKFRDYHVPVTLADYRTVYRAYLTDPDLQDARARWPFVPVWDNHEFSWLGYQSIQVVGGERRPAQTKKVAANQAWWEYQPARVARPGANRDRFEAPAVKDAPIDLDEHGFARGADNAVAIESLTIYRAFRYGRNAELILTDNRSYKIADADSSAVSPDGFPMFVDEDTARIIDDGRAANGGKPPATLHFAGKDIPNPGVDAPVQTYLGPKQRAWLIERLSASQAPWKIWGHSFGTLAWRTDLANLPEGTGPKWPGTGFALANGGYYSEHAQIYDALRKKGVTGLAVVAGDKHSFWAGLTSADLPPRAYDPVGVEFVTGSISAQGLVELMDRIVKPDHALRALYYAGEHHEIPAFNYTLLHGVRAALALSENASAPEARKLRNPAVAPHLKFVDLGGHGYGLVTATSDWLETEFVCIPVPFERSESPDGGPLRYRVRHRVNLWKAGEQPKLAQTVVEGNADYSI